MTAHEYLYRPLPDARDIVVSMYNQFLLRRFVEHEATAVAAIMERKVRASAASASRQRRIDDNERKLS